MSQVDEIAAARRPLKSRSTWWAAWLSKRLVCWNVSPNAISIWSIAFAALAAGAFVATRYVVSPVGDALLFVLAIVGIQGRLLCNMMDGMVAVEGGKRTPTGELFNEVPDRVADTLILVAAGYAGDPVYGPTLGWLAALLAMFTAYVRAVGKAAGAGTYFLGPMAKPHRMAALTVVCALVVFNKLYWMLAGPPREAMDLTGRVVAVWTDQTLTSFDGWDISLMLLIICLGCLVTTWRRLSRIVRDLRAKSSVA